MKAPKFTRVLTEMYRNWHISVEARFLMALLRSYCYGDKIECWPSADTLAKIMGCTERSIFRYAKECVKHGILKRRPKIPGNHKSGTIYTLLDDDAEKRLLKLADPKRVLKGKLVTPVSAILVTPVSVEEDNTQVVPSLDADATIGESSTAQVREEPENVIPIPTKMRKRGNAAAGQ